MLESLDRAVHRDLARHEPQAAAHAYTVLTEVEGLVKKLTRDYDNDPAIAAYQIRDALRVVRPLLDRLTNWSNAVISGDPSDVPHKGAKC